MLPAARAHNRLQGTTGTPDRGRRVRVERGIYLQPNGNYAVCVVQEHRPRFRTIGPDLAAARAARLDLLEAARRRALPLSPRTRLDTVTDRWLERFAGLVDAGERRERTLAAHRYHLQHHILPLLAARRIHSLDVEDVAEFLLALRRNGASEKTRESALGTLRMVLRYARRNGWIVEDPTSRLERHERPRRSHAPNACSAAHRSAPYCSAARSVTDYCSRPSCSAACGSPKRSD